MFERYTEAARRSLFFARFESSQYGALAITPEHLLFGILREPAPVIDRLLSPTPETLTTIRQEIANRTVQQEPVSTSVEIPFSGSTKRALQYGAEEADRLLDSFIGPEHLLLGLLREEDSVAASVLGAHGLHLDEVRQRVAGLNAVRRVADVPAAFSTGRGVERVRQTQAFDEYVGLIKNRVAVLAGTESAPARQALVDEIHTALDSLRDRL